MVWFVQLPYSFPVPKFNWDDEPVPMATFGFSAGKRWTEEEVRTYIPTSATQKDTKKMCDIFSMPNINAVSERFKAIVEEFEPGVHQFIPIQLKRKDGTPYEEQYYVFNACKMISAILAEESELPTTGWGRQGGGTRRHAL
jgi:hypothetical protein